MVRLFTGRYFRTDLNKWPYSIANYYLLTCIIKHSLSSWGVFLNNTTLRVLKNVEHKKMRKLSLQICLEFTNLGSGFFKSRQQLFAIFYVAFYSIFVSFAIFNLNHSFIFNDGSVPQNMDQLIQVITGSPTWKDLSFCLAPRPLQIILEPTRALTSASRGKFWTADWKAVTANRTPSPNMACCGLVARLAVFHRFPLRFSYCPPPPIPLPWFPHVSVAGKLIIAWTEYKNVF